MKRVVNEQLPEYSKNKIDINDLSKSVFGKQYDLNELCLKCLKKNITKEGINICEIFFN